MLFQRWILGMFLAFTLEAGKTGVVFKGICELLKRAALENNSHLVCDLSEIFLSGTKSIRKMMKEVRCFVNIVFLNLSTGRKESR